MAAAKPAPVPPPEVTELVTCLGVAGTLRLIEARGGRGPVPTPARAAGSWLVELLGVDAVRCLAAAMGGSRIEVPLCREWRTRVLLHEGGRSQAEIAQKVGVSLRQVRALAHSDWTPMPSTHKARGAVEGQMDFFKKAG
jgi:hypothetical protein